MALSLFRNLNLEDLIDAERWIEAHKPSNYVQEEPLFPFDWGGNTIGPKEEEKPVEENTTAQENNLDNLIKPVEQPKPVEAKEPEPEPEPQPVVQPVVQPKVDRQEENKQPEVVSPNDNDNKTNDWRKYVGDLNASNLDDDGWFYQVDPDEQTNLVKPVAGNMTAPEHRGNYIDQEASWLSPQPEMLFPSETNLPTPFNPVNPESLARNGEEWLRSTLGDERYDGINRPIDRALYDMAENDPRALQYLYDRYSDYGPEMLFPEGNPFNWVTESLSPPTYTNDWRTLIDQWENTEAANNELFRESLQNPLTQPTTTPVSNGYVPVADLREYPNVTDESKPYLYNEQYLKDLDLGLVDDSFTPEELSELYGGPVKSETWNGTTGTPRTSGYDRAEANNLRETVQPQTPGLGTGAGFGPVSQDTSYLGLNSLFEQNSLQDSQWLQDLVGTVDTKDGPRQKALIDLILNPQLLNPLINIADRAYVNNPVNWPFRLLGITPSNALVQTQQLIDDNVVPAINNGINSSIPVINTVLDAIPETLDTAVDIANEGAVKPILDSYLSETVPGYEKSTSLGKVVNNVEKEVNEYIDEIIPKSESTEKAEKTEENNKPKEKKRNDLQTMVDIKNGDTTYDQIYQDFYNNHAESLYQRYRNNLGYDEQTARQKADENARRLAYQKIYQLGYRPDMSNPESAKKYMIPSLGDFVEGIETATGNNYYTNSAAYDDRLINMLSGGIEGRNERLFDDLTSELAGNALINNNEKLREFIFKKDNEINYIDIPTNYPTTPKITNTDKPDDPASWNRALQAAMSGELTKEEIFHLYDSSFSDIVIPEETKEWLASDSTHSLQQLYLNMGKNGDRTELYSGTDESFAKGVNAFLDANPEIKLMLSKGIITLDDIQMNFFKGFDKAGAKPKGSGSGYGRYGGGGGGGGGYGGGGGGGSRSGSSGSSGTSKAEQRVNNIMKNWTF